MQSVTESAVMAGSAARNWGLRVAMVIIVIYISGCSSPSKPYEPDALSSAVPWQSLFNGRDLSGWTVKARADDRSTQFFRVQDGVIVAKADDSKHDYVWLYSDRQYQDFHLSLRFQGVRGEYANSGVQIRSRYDANDDGGWMNGPQVDVGFTARNGSIWDETRNNQRWLTEQYNASDFYFSDEQPAWNTLEIIALGNQITVKQNGEIVSRYDGTGVLDDNNHQDLAVGKRGHIALQIHKNDIMRIRFKDIRIRDLSAKNGPLKLLVFSKTTGYFHESINTIEQTLREIGVGNGWQVDITRGSEVFTPEKLAGYDVVFWNNTCADYAIMNVRQRQAFERYIENGGGFAGIHGAAWSAFTPRWDWYIDDLIGAREVNKNGNWEGVWREEAEIYAQSDSPITAMIPSGYRWKDEFYSMSRDVHAYQPHLTDAEQIEVLTHAIADWDYGDFRSGHPVTWRRTLKAGRMWYSAIGHNASTITDPVFQAHMQAGIEWAAGLAGNE